MASQRDRSQTPTRSRGRSRNRSPSYYSDESYSDSFASDDESHRSAQYGKSSKAPKPKDRGIDKGRKATKSMTNTKGKKGGRNSKAPISPRAIDNITKRMLSARRIKINEMRNEVEDLNVQLSELRQENKMLKRQQHIANRALDKYEVQENDMPSMIQRHSEEIRAIKEQARKQKERYHKTEKKLRSTEDELERTRRLLKKMRGLVDDKQLGERDDLNQKLSRAESDVTEKDKKIQELERHVEHLNKNHKHEFGISRARQRELERQIQELQMKSRDTDMRLKEKEKELEVRNIYSNRLVRPPHKLNSSVSSSPLPGSGLPPRSRPRKNSTPGLTPRDRAKDFEDRRRGRQDELLPEEQEAKNREKRLEEEAQKRRQVEEDSRKELEIQEWKKRAEEERRKAEEMKRKLEEDQRRADDERRRADEERRRAEEENKKAERLQRAKKPGDNDLLAGWDDSYDTREKEEIDRRNREEQERRERDERENKEKEERERREREERERQSRERQEREENDRLEQQRAREEQDRIANDVADQERQRQKKLLLAKLQAIDSEKTNSVNEDAYSPTSKKKEFQFTRPIENMHHGKPAYDNISVPVLEKNKKKNLEDDEIGGYQPSFSQPGPRGATKTQPKKMSLFDDDDTDESNVPNFGKMEPQTKGGTKTNLMESLFGNQPVTNSSATKKTTPQGPVFGSASKTRKSGQSGHQNNRENSSTVLFGGGSALVDHSEAPPSSNSHLLPKRQQQRSTTLSSRPTVKAVDDFEDDIEEVVL